MLFNRNGTSRYDSATFRYRTLQSSNVINNYDRSRSFLCNDDAHVDIMLSFVYDRSLDVFPSLERSVSLPLPSYVGSPSRRLLVCQEVPELGTVDYSRGVLPRENHNDLNTWSNRTAGPPNNIHSVLNNVWSKARAASELQPAYPPTISGFDSTQPARYPGPSDMSWNQHQAVDHVWEQARRTTEQNVNHFSPTQYNSTSTDYGFQRGSAPPVINIPFNGLGPSSYPTGTIQRPSTNLSAPGSLAQLLARANQKR
jgi:hypothetical protein